MELKVCGLRDVSEKLVSDFVESVWDGVGKWAILQKLSVYTEHATVIVGYDTKTRKIASLLVSLPSVWPLGENSYIRVGSVCNWYTSPEHKAKGVGRDLVNSLSGFTEGQYALSVSTQAVVSFQKLGWKGPHETNLLLFLFPRLRRRHQISKIFQVNVFNNISATNFPGDLAGALDFLEMTRPPGTIRRRRNANDWLSYLLIKPTRRYQFTIVKLEDIPIAYYVVRPADRGSGKMLRFIRLFFLCDLIRNTDDHVVISFISRSIGASLPWFTGALLFCSSDSDVNHSLFQNGWLSKVSFLFGKTLSHKAPHFMLGGKLAELETSKVIMTFCDSDVDLNI